MKNLTSFLISIIVALFFSTCSDDSSDPKPSQILVSVSNECLCNVFLYTPEGLCLQSRIWDCQETKLLIFNVYHIGDLIIKAEYHERSASETITVVSGKTHEIGIVF